MKSVLDKRWGHCDQTSREESRGQREKSVRALVKMRDGKVTSMSVYGTVVGKVLPVIIVNAIGATDSNRGMK